MHKLFLLGITKIRFRYQMLIMIVFEKIDGP